MIRPPSSTPGSLVTIAPASTAVDSESQAGGVIDAITSASPSAAVVSTLTFVGGEEASTTTLPSSLAWSTAASDLQASDGAWASVSSHSRASLESAASISSTPGIASTSETATSSLDVNSKIILSPGSSPDPDLGSGSIAGSKGDRLSASVKAGVITGAAITLLVLFLLAFWWGKRSAVTGKRAESQDACDGTDVHVNLNVLGKAEMDTQKREGAELEGGKAEQENEGLGSPRADGREHVVKYEIG